MTVVQTKKYIVESGMFSFNKSNIWFPECSKLQIPFIRVEQHRNDYCVHWDIGNLSLDLQKAMNEQTQPVALCVKELIETKFSGIRVWESHDNGDIFELTRETAIAIAEALAEYLFGALDLAKANVGR